MSKEIDLWKIIDKYPQSDINHPNHLNGYGDTVMGVEEVHKAMKEACRQTLELAAENVEHLWDDNENELFDIDKQSILGTINQIK